MNRRHLLHSGIVGVGIPLLSGCLGGPSRSSGSPAESGSGHACDSPRNIDYDAVDRYRDHGVYLKNRDDAAHTACVTVTKETRDREENGTSSPPPLDHRGYAIQPGMAVELFTFDESGHYTIEVSIEKTTKTEALERTERDFSDDETVITTFEITSPTRIQITQRGEP